MQRRELASALIASASAAASLSAKSQAQTDAASNYERTSGEIAAGVTPTNTSIPPGNVLRYGANSSPGSTDMTAAIQAAVNQSNQLGGAPVYIPIGKYKIVSLITARITQPLRIYGDGMGMTILVQTADAHAFAITIANGSGARLMVHDISFEAHSGGAMATGRAISLQGYTSGVSPRKTLYVRNVQFIAGSAAMEFKFGVWASGVNQTLIDNIMWDGIPGSTNSTAIHIESTTPYSVAHDISNVEAYSCNIGIDILSSSKPGVEGINITNSELVDCLVGVRCVNSLGVAVYGPPKVTFDNLHINSRSSCVILDAYVQIQMSQCLFYRFGNHDTNAHVQLLGCQFFDLNLMCAVTDATDCPAVYLDGTVSAVGNGLISGIFAGNPKSTHPLVAVKDKSAIYLVQIGKAIRGGWHTWVPSINTSTFSAGGITFNPQDLYPLSPEEISVTITPSGGVSGGGTIDISYVNSPFISLNAGAGTITGITGGKVGQRITIACDTAGVVLQHNARQIMPGKVNYTFTAGSSIDLYRINSNTWRAVGHP
jgi:hypothetical protein